MQTGQVSIFLVIGLFILLILSLLASQYDFPLRWQRSTKDQAVQQFISSCFSQSAQQAVRWFYAQDPEREFFPLLDENTVVWWPVWYDRGTINIPKDPLGWITDFATASQRRCINTFAQFPDVKQKELQVTATTYPQGIELTLHQPVSVETRELDGSYRQQVQFRLLPILEVAGQLLTTVKEQPDKIPIDFMVELGKKNNVEITYAYLENGGKTSRDIVVYQIKDLLAMTKTPSLKFIARMN